MHRLTSILVLTLLVIAACSPTPVATPSADAPVQTPSDALPSATPPTEEPPTPAITPVQDGTPVPSDAGPTGSLVVRQSSVKDLPGVFTEGAMAFVEVYDAGGALVANAANGDYLESLELLSADLPPGRYELRSYVRPCSGACPGMDPPTDECRVEVSIQPGQAVAVRIVRSVGVPCRAEVAPQ